MVTFLVNSETDSHVNDIQIFQFPEKFERPLNCLTLNIFNMKAYGVILSEFIDLNFS